MGCRVSKDALGIRKISCTFRERKKVSSFIISVPRHNTNYVFPFRI